MFITLPVLFLIAQVDKERVAQITERAVRDAEWILNKYRRQKWYGVRHHGPAEIRGELWRNCRINRIRSIFDGLRNIRIQLPVLKKST